MGLKVIGAGFGRTGTRSLKSALEILGCGKCYHMEELMMNPEGHQFWSDLYNHKNVDFQNFFEDYKSIVGFPGAIFYKRLAEEFPKAKVILTKRNPEEWYESIKTTVFDLKLDKELAWKIKWSRFYSSRARDIFRLRKLTKQLIWDHHFKKRFLDRGFTIDLYNKHIHTCPK